MFLGACLGGAYGSAMMAIWSGIEIEIAPPPAYAMVGMAAVLGGSVKAPLTAILLLFEMTRNYLIILPLMLAVGVSVWFVELMQLGQSVKGLNLQQMGVNLQDQDELEILKNVPIATVMTRDYFALPASMPLLEAGQTMLQNKCHTALVLNETQQLIGIVTLADIRREIAQMAETAAKSSGFSSQGAAVVTPVTNKLLKDICTTEVLYAYLDESVAEALSRMGARGLYLLPVVARDNPRNVLGVIERNQVALASNLAMTQAVLAMISHHSCFKVS
jgi:CBS domain-containing protein